MDEKKEQRNKHRKRRKALSIQLRQEKNQKICDNVFSLKKTRDWRNVFIYLSCDDEVNTEMIIRRLLDDDCRVYCPKVIIAKKKMIALEINKDTTFQQGAFGTKEPCSRSSLENTLSPETIDVIVFPGIVFDPQGGRIGYGGGYYDKFCYPLQNLPLLKIGLAYSVQMAKKVPQEPHDIKMDIIITEDAIIRVKR